MKKFMGRQLAIALAMGTALSFGTVSADAVVYAAEANQEANLADWMKDKNSVVRAKGIGLPSNGSAVMARVAAMMDAQRNLLGVVKGMQINSETVMEQLMVTSDTVTRTISGVLQGAQVVSEGENPDGSYYVEMVVPLFGNGGLAKAVLPALAGDEGVQPLPPVNLEELSLPKQDVQNFRSGRYTGVIIDARGLDLRPTFSPVIYDVDGKAIYGIKNIDVDFAINEGMVGYADSVERAKAVKRVGDNPLVIKAVNVRGGAAPGSRVNPVLSVNDAAGLLLANESTNFLTKSAVVFVR